MSCSVCRMRVCRRYTQNMDNLLCLRPVVLFTKDFACSSYRLSSEENLNKCRSRIRKRKHHLLTKEDVNDCVQDISYFNNQDVGALNKSNWFVTFFPLYLCRLEQWQATIASSFVVIKVLRAYRYTLVLRHI